MDDSATNAVSSEVNGTVLMIKTIIGGIYYKMIFDDIPKLQQGFTPIIKLPMLKKSLNPNIGEGNFEEKLRLVAEFLVKFHNLTTGSEEVLGELTFSKVEYRYTL